MIQSTSTRDAIADRAAATFCGTRGRPCEQCQGVLFYVSAIPSLRCRKCESPHSAAFVRLPIVLLDGLWQDGRIEARLEKHSAQSGVPVSTLRAAQIKLPVQILATGKQLWPPPYRT